MMQAAVWTAIGLVAVTSLGALFYLGARIDGLAGRIEARFDATFGVLETRFARVDSRFDSLETRLETHLDRHAS